jgi:transcription elongation factor Elf1
MNKEDIKKWMDKYSSNIVSGKFTCFFCEKEYSAKEQLGFIKNIRTQDILGCMICVKDSSAKAWEKIQELSL